MKTISIKVDTNDGDYAYIKSVVDNKDIKSIREFIDKGLSKFQPYKGSRADYIRDFRKNFPNGGRYGFNTHRPDLGGKSAYQYYVDGGFVTEEVFNTFKKYVKNRCFHTIKKIKIDKTVLFESPSLGYR